MTTQTSARDGGSVAVMARAAKKAPQANTLVQRLWEAADAFQGNKEPSLTTAGIIAELVQPVKEMGKQNQRHEALALSVAEAAFYDAIVLNDVAILQMGDDSLQRMAAELVPSSSQSATLDWDVKDSVRDAMRTKVRRLLANYDCPPDLEKRAIEPVFEQAKLYACVAGGAPA
ncbi:DUF3387 domain-containing protein [Phycicoccus sp. MAQZ13P-2]|uniref:type I restriction enzyme endonuclease domain-containing protein n=1 Tax=Phycicoccus mangrovi TaxID=2840470 RepID=UPI001C005CA5|nr:type I restriction enzyme endonuclease domain-containing protein [Phycicoccus mangrovi]MBT9255219.1 DUF3387 domain-containing protein [Phycicoccus mangrovi]MBT9274203.1 DUF3387 domain-containing protein [Phycicoccus mangrovi]